MLAKLEFDLAMATSSLHCLKMDAVSRKRVADALVPTKMKVNFSIFNIPKPLTHYVRMFYMLYFLPKGEW